MSRSPLEQEATMEGSSRCGVNRFGIHPFPRLATSTVEYYKQMMIIIIIFVIVKYPSQL